ncbi:hypothetical protein ALC57_01983, partial [Trachymyrmex cornetzi]
YPWNYIGAQKTATSKPAAENARRDRVHSVTETPVGAVALVLVDRRPKTLSKTKYTLPQRSPYASRLRSRTLDSGKILSTTFLCSRPEDSELEDSGIGVGSIQKRKETTRRKKRGFYNNCCSRSYCSGIVRRFPLVNNTSGRQRNSAEFVCIRRSPAE